jgi:AcrR family transcriptional regulator
MPLIVDREKRRRKVAAIATKMIVRQGPDAVTVRGVAAAAGYSTKVISHYFKSKDELLCFVFRETALEAARRVRRLQRSEDVQHCLELLLPLDAQTRQDWRMWIAFWGRAAFNETFALEQHASAAMAQGLIRDLLDSSRRRGLLAPEFDVDLHSRRLLAAVIGIAIQAVLDPKAWPSARQRTLLRAEIIATLPRS